MVTDAESIREKWWHEDELINQRITWLLSAHALLCTGFAWLKYRKAEIWFEEIVHKDCVTKQICTEVCAYIVQIDNLIEFVGILGLLFSFLVGLGLFAACKAMIIIKIKNWPESNDLGISPVTSDLGRLAAISLPLVCIGGWLYMLLPQFLKPDYQDWTLSIITLLLTFLLLIIIPNCFECGLVNNSKHIMNKN